MQKNAISAIDTLGNQKYLGNNSLIALLALLSAFVPLSTDIYLPALPIMANWFQAPQSLINLTLILFFIFFGIGTLIWGPLSDKYGRKPILPVGLVIYIIASILCATAINIYLLILFRALQAFGGSAAVAVATAIAKDVYSGRKRESVLALVQSMVVISPAIAPVIGALLMGVTSWRGVFLVQAVIGLVALLGSIALQETLVQKSSGTIISTIGRLAVVLKNPKFTSLLLTFSMISITTLAFVSSSSYIYQNYFRLSSKVYSYYFAFNAIGMLFGPFIYIHLSAYLKRKIIINTSFLIMAISGLMICIFGNYQPWIFTLMLLPATIAVSALRPPGVHFMLEQQKEDIGSASSLISFFSLVMGSIGIIIVSFEWSSQMAVVGALNLIFGIICGCAWLYVSRKPFIRQMDQQF